METFHKFERSDGWDIYIDEKVQSEAIHLINPFKIEFSGDVTLDIIETARRGASAGAFIRRVDSPLIEKPIGDSVNAFIWPSGDDTGVTYVIDPIRVLFKDSIWPLVRDSSQAFNVNSDWSSIKIFVWASFWASTWAYVNSLFLHKGRSYPFQDVVDLWKLGLVMTYDGSLLRLHMGPDGQIVWNGKLR